MEKLGEGEAGNMSMDSSKKDGSWTGCRVIPPFLVFLAGSLVVSLAWTTGRLSSVISWTSWAGLKASASWFSLVAPLWALLPISLFSGCFIMKGFGHTRSFLFIFSYFCGHCSWAIGGCYSSHSGRFCGDFFVGWSHVHCCLVGWVCYGMVVRDAGWFSCSIYKSRLGGAGGERYYTLFFVWVQWVLAIGGWF